MENNTNARKKTHAYLYTTPNSAHETATAAASTGLKPPTPERRRRGSACDVAPAPPDTRAASPDWPLSASSSTGSAHLDDALSCVAGACCRYSSAETNPSGPEAAAAACSAAARSAAAAAAAASAASSSAFARASAASAVPAAARAASSRLASASKAASCAVAAATRASAAASAASSGESDGCASLSDASAAAARSAGDAASDGAAWARGLESNGRGERRDAARARRSGARSSMAASGRRSLLTGCVAPRNYRRNSSRRCRRASVQALCSASFLRAPQGHYLLQEFTASTCRNNRSKDRKGSQMKNVRSGVMGYDAHPHFHLSAASAAATAGAAPTTARHTSGGSEMPFFPGSQAPSFW